MSDSEVLPRLFSMGQDPEKASSGLPGTLDGHRKTGYVRYPDIWPASALANWITGFVDTKATGRFQPGWFGFAVHIAIGLFFTFVFGYFFALFYTMSKAVFDPLISVTPHTADIAPFIYGIVRGLLWFVFFYLTVHVSGGFLMLWDTLAFAVMGWVGRDTKIKMNLVNYLWNLLQAILIVVILLLGAILGSVTTDYFIKGTKGVGGAKPENSLATREGPILFYQSIATGLFVFARMFWDNPFVLPQPTSGAITAATFAVVGVVGGYAGNTGAVDFVLPFGTAIISGKWTNLWTLLFGGLLGTSCAILLFFVATLSLSIVNIHRYTTKTSQ